MEDFEDDDAGEAAGTEPVDRVGEGNNSEFGEKQVQRTEAGEDVLDAEGANEGREDERSEQRGAEEGRVPESGSG